MRIALFHTTLPAPDRKPGGVEVAVHRLANALAADPADQVTVLSLSPAPADAAYRHRLLWGGSAALRDRQLLRLTLLPALLNAVPLDDFDVLHLHGDDWFWVRRGIPTVRTFHGLARHEARTATSRKRRIGQTVVAGFEVLAERLASRSLAVGAETARVRSTASPIDNGVDLGVFYPGPKRPAPTALFVGTWDGRKRGAFAYERFLAEVLPRVPAARLVMVCPTPPPAHPQVEHHPRPSDAVLAALYREAWALALPSAYEGFGIPYLEAMASGTAVVATPNDGSRHVLGEGRYGVLAEEATFGAEVARVLLDGEARAALERAGAERAQAFTWAAVAEAHRAVYRAAVAEDAS